MPEENKGFILKDSDAASAKSSKTTSYSLPEITFSTFIFSLNSSALVMLGAVEDPQTGQKTKNLPLAKQTIDMIAMIEEKTLGNLTNDEANLLKNILHDLRIMYVKEKG